MSLGKTHKLNPEQIRAQTMAPPKYAEQPSARRFGQKPRWRGLTTQPVTPAKLVSWIGDDGFRLPGVELGPEAPAVYWDPSPDHKPPPPRPPRSMTVRERQQRAYRESPARRVAQSPEDGKITEMDMRALERARHCDEERQRTRESTPSIVPKIGFLE